MKAQKQKLQIIDQNQSQSTSLVEKKRTKIEKWVEAG